MKTSHSIKTINLVVIILSIIYLGIENVNAQAPTMAPAPAMDCMTQLYNMSDCLTYVTQGSNTSKPDKNCCPELAGLLDSNPICLCHLLGKSSDFPISLDINRALKLPKVCRLQTPPVSMCSVIGIPVGVPTSSQAPSSAPTSTSTSTSSGSTTPGMSPTTAAAGEGSAPKNGGSMAYTRLSYIIASLAIAFTLLSTL